VFDDMKRFRPQEAQTVDAARLGEELRDARLALGLSIEDVAAELRIRRVYLIALEEGRLKDLPSPAYAVGFVRNYAGALGLDPSEMVRRLRDAVATGARKTDLVFPEPVPERGFPAGVLVLAGAVIAIGAYVAWYNWAGTGNRTVDAVPPVPARLEPAARTGEALRPTTPAPVAPTAATTPPAPNAVSTPTPPAAVIVPALPVPTPVPVQVPTPAPPPAAAAPPADQPRITLRAKAEIWTQVRDTRANQTLISRNMRAGETFVVPNREGLLLSVGNAAMLDVLVDGQPSPNFGNTPGVRRDVPLVPDQLRPRPAAATPAPPAAPAAPARLNPPANPAPQRQ
jgi:cytoskeleton protein RodZ